MNRVQAVGQHVGIGQIGPVDVEALGVLEADVGQHEVVGLETTPGRVHGVRQRRQPAAERTADDSGGVQAYVVWVGIGLLVLKFALVAMILHRGSSDDLRIPGIKSKGIQSSVYSAISSHQTGETVNLISGRYRPLRLS